MIKRGDRVKLTSRAAATFNNNKPHKFNWTDRCGVVERISANKANVIVLWDGRKSTDYCRSAALNPNQQSWDNPKGIRSAASCVFRICTKAARYAEAPHNRP